MTCFGDLAAASQFDDVEKYQPKIAQASKTFLVLVSFCFFSCFVDSRILEKSKYSSKVDAELTMSAIVFRFSMGDSPTKEEECECPLDNHIPIKGINTRENVNHLQKW